MPTQFKPRYSITNHILNFLLHIEQLKEQVSHLPLTPSVLASLRETARLSTTHYSTMIEGNRLDPSQIEVVIKKNHHFPGRERDEYEIKGYYSALTQVEQWATQNQPITEKMIQTLHALVINEGKSKIKPTPYRNGQNVIRDARTGGIVYLPPEAKDVPDLMRAFINWVNTPQDIPCALIAGIAHYQFATIHPYYDGNGRTARLITTLILHLGGYDLKGLYSLEEYYTRRLSAYYDAISIGDSHNYYMGRSEADITPWIEYFLEGMIFSFENVLKHMKEAQKTGSTDQSDLLKQLEPRQRKILIFFQDSEVITAKDVAEFFGFKTRTSTEICKNWVENGFLEVIDPSNKSRKYKLSVKYQKLI